MIWTIGHSNLPLEVFVHLLVHHGIEELADVRRYSGSRRNPHFGGASLAHALAHAGITYRHWPDLGGHREPVAGSPHRAIAHAALRGYADHASTDVFRRALRELVACATCAHTAVACAEKRPENCHRSILSDVLLHEGVDVRHIVGEEPPFPHVLARTARLERGGIVYDGGELSFDLD